MKKIILIIGLPLLALTFGCMEEGRIDQIDNTLPAPSVVTVRSITPKPGGAVICYDIPNDDNLLAVKVVYERNGQLCENMSSRFVDSLVVEGFGDTNVHKAKLYSVGVNGKLSEDLPITIEPKAPSVKTTEFEINETFGGISVDLYDNIAKDMLSVVILRDSVLADNGKEPSEITWEELYTFHTSAEKTRLARRGLDSKTMLYGVYLRDRWGNTSPIKYKELTPVEEMKLPNYPWTNAALQTDSWQAWSGMESWCGMQHLWDNDYHGQNGAWASATNNRVVWVTINLGYSVKLSRMQMFFRELELYSSNAPRHFQIWGSMEPNPNGSWDDSWYLLGDFEVYKPSGYQEDGSVGTITDEDKEYWWNTSEYMFEEPSEDIPDPNRECRYIRIKLLDNYVSYGIESDFEYKTFYVIGEIVLYGQMTNPEEKELYSK